MERIIEKLGQIDYGKNVWKDWNLEEIKQLLEIYLVISKKEDHIYDLIYHNHGCDTYEDIFRDYNDQHFEDKVSGVQEALDNVNYNIQQNQDCSDK